MPLADICSAVQQTAQLFDHLVISDARLNSAGEHLLRLREIFTWPVETMLPRSIGPDLVL
jgi:hypothetical protein